MWSKDNLRRHLLWVAPASLVLALGPVFAEDMGSKAGPSAISNVGFVKNPSEAMRKKFPMCDAFLNVEWIDREKRIGYASYEAIVKNKGNQFKGEKKMLWALVDLNGAPGIDYDVYEYKRKGRLDEIFERVRKGRVEVGIGMTIKYKGETVSLYGGKAVNAGSSYPLLSDHRQTVCVVYPDERHAWIAEGRSVKNAYSEEQIELLSRRVKETGKPIPKERLESFWVLDFNFDGKDDYIYLHGQSIQIEYSWSNLLYQGGGERELKNRRDRFVFPPQNRTCYLRYGGLYRLTTDGRNYYLDEQCNLTELTSQSVKGQ